MMHDGVFGIARRVKDPEPRASRLRLDRKLTAVHASGDDHVGMAFSQINSGLHNRHAPYGTSVDISINSPISVSTGPTAASNRQNDGSDHSGFREPRKHATTRSTAPHFPQRFHRLEQDGLSSKHHPALSFCSSIISTRTPATRVRSIPASGRTEIVERSLDEVSRLASLSKRAARPMKYLSLQRRRSLRLRWW